MSAPVYVGRHAREGHRKTCECFNCTNYENPYSPDDDAERIAAQLKLIGAELARGYCEALLAAELPVASFLLGGVAGVGLGAGTSTPRVDTGTQHEQGQR